jgi:hypothetical protein
MSDSNLDFLEFVELVLDALHAAGVEYLIGGAVAAWAWGEPRSTLDLDLVVDIPTESIGKLSYELEIRDMLVPVDIILGVLVEERADLPINAIHMHSGYKADLYPLRSTDELRKSAFQRRIKVDFGPPLGEVFLHSPEDLIIYKLWYFSLSQQTKHLQDVAAILSTLHDQLDYSYIEFWAREKGVISVWKEWRANYLPPV